jgi:hypothetical protein
MKLRQFFLVMLILCFLITGCLGGSGDDKETAPHETPENAMDEETKQEFDQLMEEYQKTGKIPDKLSEISSAPPESNETSAPTGQEQPADDNSTSN